MKIESIVPYKLVNKLYLGNFNLYKRIYFLYKYILEHEEISVIKKYIKPGMRVIDIGANIGFYTLLFSDLVGKKGKVYSFEPEKQNFINLKKLCGEKKNIVLNNFAVGEKTGKTTLYLSDNLNVDHCTYDNNENRKHLSVKCISIDQYFKNNEKIDFVKIDTQGFEYQVLLGMKNSLKRSKNVRILCEMDPLGLKKAGYLSKKLTSLLSKWGFRIKHLNKNPIFYSDVFAIKSGNNCD